MLHMYIYTVAFVLFINGSSAQDCEEKGLIRHINWDNLMNSEDPFKEMPQHSCDIEFVPSKYVLTIDCRLEYLGYATDNLLLKGEESLGITYQLGLNSFVSTRNTINKPGTCSNRIGTAFEGITNFNHWWNYSTNPSQFGQIGQSDGSFLAYPKTPNHYQVFMEQDCDVIRYAGDFSWTDLRDCEDPFGSKVISIADNPKDITLSGTVYVNIVSPHVMGETDTGHYRVYPLIQQDWQLIINKQINVLSSTETKLFLMSILSVYEDEADGAFRMILFTQSADYITLSDPVLIESPFKNSAVNVKILTPTEGANQCIHSSSYTCGQLFEIHVPKEEFKECPPMDFSGKFLLGFTANCRTEGSDICATFIDDNEGSAISLEVYSNFRDNTCEPEIYRSVLEGQLNFFTDADFTTLVSAEDPYVIGQDTIYCQVNVRFPDDGTGANYDVFDMDLINVFVCTVPVESEADIKTNLDQVLGSGGCLSALVDTDGSHIVIENGVADAAYGAEIHLDTLSNRVQFSFDTFATGRETIFVHVQTMLELQPVTERRRLLLAEAEDPATSSQFRHFVGSVDVSPAEIIDEEEDDGVNAVRDNEQNGVDVVELIAILVAAVAVVVIVSCAVVWCCYMRKAGNEENKARLTEAINVSDDATQKRDRVTSVSIN